MTSSALQHGSGRPRRTEATQTSLRKQAGSRRLRPLPAAQLQSGMKAERGWHRTVRRRRVPPQVHVTVIHMACKQPEGQGAPQVHVALIHMACKQPEGQGAPQVHVTLVHMACKQHSQDSEPAQLLFSLCTPFPGQHKHRCCHSRMLQSALIGWSLHSTRCLGQQWTTASPLPCLPAYDSLG